VSGWRARAVEVGYAAAWRLVRVMPLPVARAVFEAGADRAARRRGPAATRLAENLLRVVGPVPSADLDALVRRGLRSYARYWRQAFRLPSLSRDAILTSFRLENEEVLAAAVAAGRGIVLALPHGGNWDAAGAWVAAKGWPIVTVAERLRPEGVYERFLAFRRGLGMEILPLTGGDRPAITVLAERIGQGFVVPLLSDRDLSARGVDVRFFGGRTRMPAGPALLALRTGAPLYTVDMWFDGDLPVARLRGPIELPGSDTPMDDRIRLVTQRIADGLAAGIARHPEDWHMLQRVWLDGDLDGDEAPGRPGAPGAGLAEPVADVATPSPPTVRS
jgi:phosphatidylinositol dimannoside acyltransferase